MGEIQTKFIVDKGILFIFSIYDISNRPYSDTNWRIRPIRQEKSYSIVVKMLKLVLGSACDGVPLKCKKENGRPYSLTIRIVRAQFRPPIVFAGQLVGISIGTLKV